MAISGPSTSPRRSLNEDFYFEMDDVSDEEGILDEVKTSTEYQELLWLKRIRREKEWQLREGGGDQVHHGFKCDGCDMEPIRVGVVPFLFLGNLVAVHLKG